jgi:hypothetical protein
MMVLFALAIGRFATSHQTKKSDYSGCCWISIAPEIKIAKGLVVAIATSSPSRGGVHRFLGDLVVLVSSWARATESKVRLGSHCLVVVKAWMASVM